MVSDTTARAFRTVALAGVCMAVAAGVASADIDPASDVLLQQDVYVPYQPAVCTEEKVALQAATKKAKTAGYQLKVAVIASQTDLGGAPEFFGEPTKYARFLGEELAASGPHGHVRSRVHLITLMPQGWGLYQVDPRANGVLQAIKIPSGADSSALARAAIRAVPKVATIAGHPTPAVKTPSGCSHSSGTPVLVFMAPFLLVISGLLVNYLVGRRNRASSAPAGQSSE
jgi:hypothetical protein